MSTERRDQLVDDIIEAQPKLRAFLRPMPSDLTVGSWDFVAYSFQRGFETMWDHARSDLSGLLLRPLLLLWRQSVELAIKSAISELAGGLDRNLGMISRPYSPSCSASAPLSDISMTTTSRTT